MRRYLAPRARILPFCSESALLQNSSISVEVDPYEDVNEADKSNHRTIWDCSL